MPQCSDCGKMYFDSSIDTDDDDQVDSTGTCSECAQVENPDDLDADDPDNYDPCCSECDGELDGEGAATAEGLCTVCWLQAQ